MRRRHVSPIIMTLLFLALAAYIVHLRVKPADHYAKLFDHMRENCELNQCPLEEKLTFAQKTVYHDPEFRKGYTYLAHLYEEIDNGEQAYQFHKKALQLDHRNRDSLFSLGVYYFDSKKLEQALRYLNHAYSQSTRGDNLNYYLGRIYEKKGDYKKAFQFYTRAYQLGRDNMALARLGIMKSFLGEKDKIAHSAVKIRKKGDEELASALEEYAQVALYEEFRPNEKCCLNR